MRTRVISLAFVLALASAAQTFPVAGTVVDSESGKPLDRTRVRLRNDAGAEWSVITTASGRFSLDVPQGRYLLWAAHRDWGNVYGAIAPGSDSGSSVVTGPDRDTTRLLFRFSAPVAIHGKIVDESGEPIPLATMELFRQTVSRGRKRLASLGRAEADDFGNYSFSWLDAGTFYLAVTGEPWYVTSQFGVNEDLADSGTPPVPYAPVYYPDSADPNAAAPVVLRPGGVLQADFTLRPAAGANLRLVCPEGAPCLAGSFTLHAAGPGRAETLIRPCASGCFDQIASVPPGRYVLRYSSPQGAMRKILEVHGGDSTIQIEPKPVPALSGMVTFQNPANRPLHPLYVNLEDEDTGQTLTVAAGADAGFAWPEVTASRVRLFLSGDDGFFVAKMSVDGASARDGVIDVADGASIRVHLLASGETGRLEGFVRQKEQAVPDVLTILAPAGGSTDPSRYLAAPTGSDGSFQFPNAPAGDYLLFAVNNLELAYAEVDVVRPYLAGGKRVRIQAHHTSKEDIGLADAASR